MKPRLYPELLIASALFYLLAFGLLLVAVDNALKWYSSFEVAQSITLTGWSILLGTASLAAAGLLRLAMHAANDLRGR